MSSTGADSRGLTRLVLMAALRRADADPANRPGYLLRVQRRVITTPRPAAAP